MDTTRQQSSSKRKIEPAAIPLRAYWSAFPIGKFLLLIASSVVTLLTIEAILWAGFPISQNPTTQLVFTQDLPGLAPTVTYAETKHGFRSGSIITESKPENVIRILALGASTTQQTTQGLEDTWSNRLEVALNNLLVDTGSRIEIGAFGRGGLRAGHLYDWARFNLNRFDPDIVITLLGVNDLAFGGGKTDPIQEHPPDGFSAGLARVADVKKEGPRGLNQCLRFSQLCRQLSIAAGRIQNTINILRGDAVEWHSSRLPDRRQDLAQLPYVERPKHLIDPIDQFSSQMGAILQLIRAIDAEPVLLGQPVLWNASMTTEEEKLLWFPLETAEGPVRASPSWLASEMQRYNEVQSHLAEEHGAMFVNLDQHIPKTSKHYFDDCHYTDLGSQRLAEITLQKILPLVRERATSIAQPDVKTALH